MIAPVGVLLLATGCVPDASPGPCQPLRTVPIRDLSGTLGTEELDEVRRLFVDAGAMFPVERCVTDVFLDAPLNEDEDWMAGVYQDWDRSIGLDIDLGIDSWVVRHELCHAADFDAGWLSLQAADAVTSVNLVGCAWCDDYELRLVETFADNCADGPQPVMLRRRLANAFGDDAVDLTALDELFSDRVFAHEGWDVDPGTVSVALPEGVPLIDRDTISLASWLRVGDGGDTYALVHDAPDTVDLAYAAGLDALHGPTTGPRQMLARVDPVQGFVSVAGGRPWAGRQDIADIMLRDGTPGLAVGLDLDDALVTAWLLREGAPQELAVPDGLIPRTVSGGRVLLTDDGAGPLRLYVWDPDSGALDAVDLPDDLRHAEEFVVATPRDDGWLVTLREHGRGVALWLESDLRWTRRATLPGAWELYRVFAYGDGMAMLVYDEGGPGNRKGWATWQPDAGWRVGWPTKRGGVDSTVVVDGELWLEWWTEITEDDASGTSSSVATFYADLGAP